MLDYGTEDRVSGSKADVSLHLDRKYGLNALSIVRVNNHVVEWMALESPLKLYSVDYCAGKTAGLGTTQ